MRTLLPFFFVLGCAHLDVAPAPPTEPASAESAFNFHGFASSDQPSGGDTHEVQIDLERHWCSLIDSDNLRTWKAEGSCNRVDRDNGWLILMFEASIIEYDAQGNPAPGEPTPIATSLRFTMASALSEAERAAWLEARAQAVADAAQAAGAEPSAEVPNLEGALLLEWENPSMPSPGRAYRP